MTLYKTCRPYIAAFLLWPVLIGHAYAFDGRTPLPDPFSDTRPEKIYTHYRSLASFPNPVEIPGTTVVPFDPAEQQMPSLFAYGKGFFPDLVGGTKRIFSWDNLTLALVGSALAALTANVDHVDKNVKTYFQTRRPMDGIAHYGDTLGAGYYHVGAGAALLTAGELWGNKKLADTGVVVLEALLVNGIATQGLKYGTHRLRPNGGDHMSFPSGHVSSTTTLAASISEMYDWDPKIAVPLYATAVFVGASRIQDNMHYLSDVIAGLTLGTVIGTSLAKYNKEKTPDTGLFRKISFSPIIEDKVKGGVFTVRW